MAPEMAARVGFVEDCDEDFAVFARVFSLRWDVERWVSGEQARGEFESEDPSVTGLEVLLVDNDLPGIDGVAVIERVRACPGGDLPVVCMVSGSGRSGLAAAASAAGADAFIEKPADLAGNRELADRVAAMAGGR